MKLPDTARGGAAALVVALVVAGLVVVVLVAVRSGVARGEDEGSGAGTSADAPSSPLPTREERDGRGSAAGSVAGPPIHLEIPAIGTSAEVVPISLAGTTLVPPSDVRLVGWWDGGSRVGDERGTVLLAGHSFSRGDGVFDDLGRVGRGDLIAVDTARRSVVYLVSAVLEYGREQLAAVAPELFGQQGQPQLVLATCSGYDGTRYNTITIVVAKPLLQKLSGFLRFTTGRRF